MLKFLRNVALVHTAVLILAVDAAVLGFWRPANIDAFAALTFFSFFVTSVLFSIVEKKGG